MPPKFVLAALTLATPLSSHAQSTIAPRPFAPGAVEIQWPSQIGRSYSLMSSTDLVNFTPWATGLEATPPRNTAWVDTTGLPKRLFRVAADPAPAGPLNLVSNGDFSDGFTAWNVFVNAAATATVGESGGELVAAITNGGTSVSHVQALHPGLPLVNGETYTLSFEARSVGANRPITVRVQTPPPGPFTNYFQTTTNITTTTINYQYTFTMSVTDPAARISFSLGNNTNDVIIDNVSLTAGFPIVNRAAAHTLNRRLAGGNNFAAYMSVPGWGAPEDYTLLNSTHFSHCRIGYKMDEQAGTGPSFILPAADLDELQSLVDFCLAEGLIPIVDPVHNWAATGFEPATDLSKLQGIWEQVASHFAGYPTSEVLFEIINEPRSGDDVASIITTGLAAIRGVPGNEERIVIVSGDGFSTRQALIDALDDDEIPANDDFLIATFHYYDPFTFTRQGDTAPPAIPWGTPAEFDAVGTAFDAVVTANNNFANRHGTEPLPIYMGEFGVDNAAPPADRKAWLAWIRMQAEGRGFSWCHWLMYNDLDTSKGLGPWDFNTRNNPSLRSFQPDAVEALHTRYEAEDGTFTGNAAGSNTNPGFTGSGYASFPASTGAGDYVEIDAYAPRDDSYKIRIRYAAAADSTATLTTLNGAAVVQTQPVTFPATGGATHWATIEVPATLPAGDNARIRIVSGGGEGPVIDYVRISR